MANRDAKAGPPADPRARRVVWVVFVTVFLDLIGFGIVIPFLPLYVGTMGGSARTVGVLISCFSFTQLIATPLLGRLSDRVGRRKVILLSLAGNAASMVLFALAAKVNLLWLLFTSRIVAGATAGNISACQAAIADVTEGPARARGMGRLGAGIGLGIALGPALGGVLSELGAWVPPLAAAALALADLVAAAFVMPETLARRAEAPTPSTRAPRHGVFTRRPLQVLLALYFCAFLLVSNLPTSLPLFVRDEFHWGKLGVAWLFTAAGAIGVAIQGFAIERITRAFGEMRSMVLGCLLCTVGLAGSGWFQRPGPFVASLGVFLVGLGIVQPMLASVASRLAPRAHQGTVLGVAQSAGGLARTVGPTASGFLYDVRGPSSPFAWSAVVAAVSVLLAAWLRVLDGEEAADPETADVEKAADRSAEPRPRPGEGQ